MRNVKKKKRNHMAEPASGEVLGEYPYLRGFSDDFRDQADVELVVEGEHKLPCHSVTLRLNSRVFDKLLEKESFDQNESKQAERVRVPMIGESLSEVHTLLDSIYSPHRLFVESEEDFKTLLSLAHKYDMPRLQAALKQYLMPGLALEVAPAGLVPRSISAALIWLQHCHRFGIEEYVKECELLIGQHYLELANGRAEELASLSGSSLVRISQAYARSCCSCFGGANWHSNGNFADWDSSVAAWLKDNM